MPYDITELQTGIATCTSALGIEVTYRLANITENTVTQLTLLANKDGAVDTRYLRALTRAVCQLVIAWDLTNHGAPVPVTRAAVADVPVEIRADVLAAVVGDAKMGEAEGTRSPQPSHDPSGTVRRGSSARRASSTASRRR